VSLKDIRPALRAYLLADASVSDAVGGDRIYPVRLPQNQRSPSIVYNRISAVGDHHMEGPSGLAQTRIQIDAWATTQDAAVELADLVKERLDGASGEILFGSASPSESLTLQGAFFDSEREDYDDAAELYRVSRDFIVWYAER
jgi:hypothetical protein